MVAISWNQLESHHCWRHHDQPTMHDYWPSWWTMFIDYRKYLLSLPLPSTIKIAGIAVLEAGHRSQVTGQWHSKIFSAARRSKYFQKIFKIFLLLETFKTDQFSIQEHLWNNLHTKVWFQVEGLAFSAAQLPDRCLDKPCLEESLKTGFFLANSFANCSSWNHSQYNHGLIILLVADSVCVVQINKYTCSNYQMYLSKEINVFANCLLWRFPG